MSSPSSREINQSAMEEMTRLHESLLANGWQAHEREVLLVRLLFCLFADDTEIFPEGSFFRYVLASREDGRDLAERLNALFLALDTAPEARGNLTEELRHFPYINGKLFAEPLPAGNLDGEFRRILLEGHAHSWGGISPEIFGAMFQEIMNQKQRREWGSYYTSEENIRKLIGPLFLDGLWEEFRQCRGRRRKLSDFHEKLTRLTFLDPACGCGNFLIVTYRELRRLELAVIRELYDTRQRVLDVGMFCRVQTGQFFGIEVESFQVQIARVGMWLADHQCNREAAELFGMYYARIPLVQSAEIVQANALTADWAEVIPPQKLSYIIGNPPFVGARLMTAGQKQDLRLVFGGTAAAGNLDYVTGWYRRAAAFMQETGIRAAFVSTNSICQGEQASLLWKNLKYNYRTGIDFAHRTFVWNSEAKGQAKVHCVIIGFSDRAEDAPEEEKLLFDGGSVRRVPHINAYLAAAPDVFVESRRRPIAEVPPMSFGSMANDGGHLILEPTEADELVQRYPELAPILRPFIGAEEYIHGKERRCLWFAGQEMEQFERIPEVSGRILAVRRYREESARAATRKLARTPHLFGEIRQPEEGSYILVPRVSSHRREYIPMGFLSARVIATDSALIVPEADTYLFGILTSAMHMAWVRAVAGRLKSDYRYSASIVYNNFPFPDPEPALRERIAACAAEILAVRGREGGCPADLYDREKMPAALIRAHRELDAAVDAAYGGGFRGEEERAAHLMECHAVLTGERSAREI